MTTYIPHLTLPLVIFEKPAVSILLPIAVGTAVGFSVQQKSNQKTYLALKQPPYRPPPQVFGPVWTLMYGLMGYAAHRAVSTALSPLRPLEVVQAAKHGATLYTIQLGLNLLWMPLFFVARRPIEATVDIVALTGVVGYLTYVWSKVDVVASWALAPYLGWLCYASYLSVGVGYLNNWRIANKETDSPPTAKGKETLFVENRND